MEWTKIPTDLLLSRKSDKEILAITKYQLLWAMLEREPDDDTALRYMTPSQLSQVRQYISSISCQVNADIKSVESHRKRQKLYYKKNQIVTQKNDGQYDQHNDSHNDSQSALADKIRLDKIRLDKSINNNININNNNLNTHTQSNLNISPRTRVREEFLQRAKKLEEILSKFHKIEFPQDEVTEWGVEIAALQKQNKIPLKRMDKVLKMLSDYIDEDYIPTISNGKDFRTKFIALEKQLEKVDSKYDWKVEW